MGGGGASGNYGKAWGDDTTRHYAADPEAAKRLADIADRQVVMAEEAWSIYQTDFLPYEQDMIQANIDLIDPNKELMTAQVEAETALTPERQEATKAALDEMVTDIEEGRPVKAEMLKQQLAQLEAEGRLLPEREKVARLGLEERAKEIGLSGPAAEKFYKEAVEGVSAEEKRGEASADVEQTYGQALKEARRDLSRAGVAPGSKKYQEMMSDMIYQKAKAGAGARTRATREAGKESFRRLGAAMSVRGRPGGAGPMAGGRTGPLPGSMVGGAPGATPYRAGGLAQPTAGTGTMAGGMIAGAGATSAAGLKPAKTTKEWESQEVGLKGGYG